MKFCQRKPITESVKGKEKKRKEKVTWIILKGIQFHAFRSFSHYNQAAALQSNLIYICICVLIVLRILLVAYSRKQNSL